MIMLGPLLDTAGWSARGRRAGERLWWRPLSSRRRRRAPTSGARAGAGLARASAGHHGDRSCAASVAGGGNGRGPDARSFRAQAPWALAAVSRPARVPRLPAEAQGQVLVAERRCAAARTALQPPFSQASIDRPGTFPPKPPAGGYVRLCWHPQGQCLAHRLPCICFSCLCINPSTF